ncbi:unnamed protein product, partial [Mycena citricolor]
TSVTPGLHIPKERAFTNPARSHKSCGSRRSIGGSSHGSPSQTQMGVPALSHRRPGSARPPRRSFPSMPCGYS